MLDPTAQTDYSLPAPSSASGSDSIGFGFDQLYGSSNRVAEPLEIPFAFPGIADNPIGALHCATTTIDDHGRLSDRSTLKALKWTAGQNVSFDGDHRMVIARCVRQSRWTVGRNGYLRLPAASRHRCNLNPGDRALIAADLTRDIAVILPIPVVAAALWNYLPEPWQRAS
ncbi:hypothetical protein [Nocardia sp. CA-119907]|uniref:hypothetical protein n=1 Tax=Nocardia sp. CA-119907 TaxID=3239973 RepID=UPI003D95D9BA